MGLCMVPAPFLKEKKTISRPPRFEAHREGRKKKSRRLCGTIKQRKKKAPPP